MFKKSQDPIDSFIDSLSYWQELNLLTVLIKSQHPELSLSEAKREAVLADDDELRSELDEALNSPI
ncbi:hypothetical protein IMAU10237_00833 [Lactiplantibacillus plantarum]|uniref:hypothetical protein n=1 Tax=Lactiplantibacillus plantarum TaxID=1590 RepID=UPI0007875F2B|nr:hypothetical protein [Lactiplantibacillus plantarum]KYK53858.1 hypothetical protein AYO51_12525 [Lactiplantibacillus plantarum]KYM68209.1 hypothetical protein AZJ01_15320 [Lactiplantibacillus plantarum]KZU09531.1 hypothetical protein Nizo2263_1147 [Lactiplantibacillus plantarum]MCG0809843.1 hypothetical protein [Lactiplantibacillus plantarum]MCG0892502.1 hypothetical protein [Lactiplantibacillus plantarum]